MTEARESQSFVRVSRVPNAETRCPYCHETVSSIEDKSCFCDACLARHHRDCWRELGACAVCGEWASELPSHIEPAHVDTAPSRPGPRSRPAPIPRNTRFTIVPLALLAIASFVGPVLAWRCARTLSLFDAPISAFDSAARERECEKADRRREAELAEARERENAEAHEAEVARENARFGAALGATEAARKIPEVLAPGGYWEGTRRARTTVGMTDEEIELYERQLELEKKTGREDVSSNR